MIPISMIISVLWVVFLSATIWGLLTRNARHAVIAERLCMVAVLPIQWWVILATDNRVSQILAPVIALATGATWAHAERNWDLVKQRNKAPNGK